MRGTHRVWKNLRHYSGIIPAYAGNTTNRQRYFRVRRDHPRVCGEHPYRIIPIPKDMGSSPRMRGTLSMPDYIGLYMGIIPAYAGNTCMLIRTGGCARDHPRVCGEHYRYPLHTCRRMRIIPAYAGNTSTFVICIKSVRDHPRVCGEHQDRDRPSRCDGGSSPRMRGTHGMYCAIEYPHGIIPAYAGNTSGTWLMSFKTRDHPRVCGEHIADKTDRMAEKWIIPAYAGNTDSLTLVESMDWDHPRVCGEHAHCPCRLSARGGSSPRMRGTQNVSLRCCSTSGIIPAYAGNTRSRR